MSATTTRTAAATTTRGRDRRRGRRGGAQRCPRRRPSIGAAAHELHLPTVRAEAARLAEIAVRARHTPSGVPRRSPSCRGRRPHRAGAGSRRVAEARFPRLKRPRRVQHRRRPPLSAAVLATLARGSGVASVPVMSLTPGAGGGLARAGCLSPAAPGVGLVVGHRISICDKGFRHRAGVVAAAAGDTRGRRQQPGRPRPGARPARRRSGVASAQRGVADRGQRASPVPVAPRPPHAARGGVGSWSSDFPFVVRGFFMMWARATSRRRWVSPRRNAAGLVRRWRR